MSLERISLRVVFDTLMYYFYLKDYVVMAYGINGDTTPLGIGDMISNDYESIVNI